MHILKSELLEISIVAVPADCGALITERALPSMSKPTIGALRAALSELAIIMPVSSTVSVAAN